MASSKPTAVHFSLIAFVMLTVIFFVAWYMMFRDYRELSGTAQADKDKLNTETRLARDLDDKIQSMKKLIGYDYNEIGDEASASTVIGSMKADLDKIDALPAEKYNYKGAVDKLLTDLQNMTVDRDKFRTQLDGKIEEYVDLKNVHQQTVNEHESARGKAETDLENQIDAKKEEVSSRDKAIDELRTVNSELQVTLEDERTAGTKLVKSLRNEISELTIISDLVREKLDKATTVSFEIPDGTVRWIDNLSGLVWINLGQADNLNTRTTFSVYTKANSGVGRGKEDIKGSIEVTRIVDAHTAEARILWDDIYRPVAKGDPIYTPLWAPGRRERFAVVGLIDLDADGDYDRDEFRKIVAGSGASIDHEVDDIGKRLHYTRFPEVSEEWQDGMPGIDVNTKFLIIGEIPDPSETSLQEEKDQIQSLQSHLKNLRQEARRQGTRVISLNDFLSFIGYKPQRRLFIPGEKERPFNLKAGAHSTATNESVGNRESSGRVSSAYGGSQRLKPKTSAGQTSKLFGGY